MMLNELKTSKIQEKTINDFGVQWNKFPTFEGYAKSLELFFDIIGPFLNKEDFKDKIILDLGAGTGRYSEICTKLQIKTLYVLEPSSALQVAKKNLAAIQETAEFLNKPIEDTNFNNYLDIIFSIGVVHHIPSPDISIRACHSALKPGGKIVLWLYGKEGNELYLKTFGSLRKLTTLLPSTMIWWFSKFLYYPLWFYYQLCRHFNLPLKTYLTKVFPVATKHGITVNIYDQLKPTYAKYYTKKEAISLLEKNGFKNVQIRHHLNYSWTVYGQKLEN